MSKTSLLRVSDSALLDVFLNKILKKFHDYSLTESSTVSVRIGTLTYQIKATDVTLPKVIDEVISSTSFGSAISNITFSDKGSFSSWMYQYKRGEGNFIDIFESNTSNTYTETHNLLEITVNNLLQSVGDRRFTAVNDTSELSSAHHQVLTSLETMSAKLLEKQVDHSQKLEADKQAFLNEQAEKQERKLNALDESYAQKSDELEERYQQRNAELDERQKQIDDADNTTARRKTTTKTLEEAHQKAKDFSFSKQVNHRNIYVGIIVVFLVLSGLAIMIFGYNDLAYAQDRYSRAIHDMYLINNKDNESSTVAQLNPTQLTELEIIRLNMYVTYIRILLGGFLMVSSAVYLVRWLNSWANRLAHQELESQQFIRDLNRAHLAVEMSLEWNEKKQGAVPDRLLNSITEGLFQRKEPAKSELLHPAEQIAAAVIKTSDKVTFPLGSSQIETSGKALKKADKLTDKTS